MGLSLSGMPDGREEEEPDDYARPIRLSPRRGARVAPQRCPILQAGKKKRNIKTNGGEALTNVAKRA